MESKAQQLADKLDSLCVAEFAWKTLGEAATELRRLDAQVAAQADSPHRPIDMVLHCPACGLQHIDAPDTNYDPHYEGHMVWHNPPHRSHLCHGCGHIWRPADVPTNGVQAVKTKGKADSPIASHGQAPVKLPQDMGHKSTDGDGPVGTALVWLQSALNCKAFEWDWDQHECAQQTLEDAKKWMQELIRLNGKVPE